MARNLQCKLQPSDTVTLYDVNVRTMERLAAELRASRTGGGTGAAVLLAKDALELRDLDTVLMALPEPQHVASLFERFTGIAFDSGSSNVSPQTSSSSNLSSSSKSLPASPPPPATAADDSKVPGTLFIDCSTIDPQTSRRCASMVAEASSKSSSRSLRPGSAMVDAPMSGGVVGAAAGTLTFMLGASPGSPIATRAERVLRLMGSRVLCCGSSGDSGDGGVSTGASKAHGSGLAAKLANNYLLAIENIAVCEAMALGTRLGVDPAVLAGVINASTGRCWASEVNNPVPGVVASAPATRGYTGGFGIALMRKDLGLAWKAGLGVAETGKMLDMDGRMRLGAEARRVYELAEAEERCRGKDFSVVWRWVVDEDGGEDGG